MVAKSRGFIRDAYVKNLRPPSARSSAATTRPSRSPIPIPEQRNARGPDPLLDGVDPRLRQRLRDLCARRARLQDRDDLRPARRRHLPANGIGASGRARAARASPTICASCWRSMPVVPAADRARLQRHGHALRGDAATCSTTCRRSATRRARSSSSIAAATCSTSMQNRAKAFSADAKTFYQATQ